MPKRPPSGRHRPGHRERPLRARRVSSVHGVSPWKLAAKGTIAGKAAGALWRQRRAPLGAWRAWGAARRDGPPPVQGNGHGGAVFFVLAGPRQLEPLDDLLDSIAAYEGRDARVLVVDDATPDVRWPQLRHRHPNVDVVRARWPSGGPPHLPPLMARGLRAALERYEFDVLCQLDTDALLTGPGLPAAAAARFAADPGLGLLGTAGLCADGVVEDFTYDAWILEHECRYSRVVSDRVARARAGGYDGTKVHGGVYVVSRAALEAAAAAGDLDRQPPWWSQIGDDLWLTLTVCAAGFRIASWGAPGEPIASTSHQLPVPLDELDARGVLAVHSVRRGASGEGEADVRAALRRRRAAA
jgi:hypothetical protein